MPTGQSWVGFCTGKREGCGAWGGWARRRALGPEAGGLGLDPGPESASQTRFGQVQILILEGEPWMSHSGQRTSCQP